ncbi:unnamed protein product [Gordionus sp. m RMFG-2023]
MKYSLDNSFASYIRLLKPISVRYTTPSHYLNPVDALLDRSNPFAGTNSKNWFNYDIGYIEMTTEISIGTSNKIYRKREEVSKGSKIIWPTFGGNRDYDFGTKSSKVNPDMSSRGVYSAIEANPVISVNPPPMRRNPFISMNTPMKGNLVVMNHPTKVKPSKIKPINKVNAMQARLFRRP